ncbi:MAG TPA: DNA polymerase III subunit alpha [Candidatus Micrarchaeia archaeon]|nr:DNA polymerase III subunit alpha [Candidatus Micrarchaeia archaeon]
MRERGDPGAGAAGFVECWARSSFSFLEGVSPPEALVRRAAALGMPALGLVDRNGLYGAVRLARAAAAAGIGALVGAECDLAAGGRLVFLAEDQLGYQQLSRLVSRAQLAGGKGTPRLELAGLDAPLAAAVGSGEAPPLAQRDKRGRRPGRRAAPTSAALDPDRARRVDPEALDHCRVIAGGPHSPITAALVRGDRERADAAARQLARAFGGGRAHLALLHHRHPGDLWLVAETAACADRAGIGVVATQAPRYATAEEAPLLDVCQAIRHGVTLEQAQDRGWLLPNHGYALESGRELSARLAHPAAIAEAARLGARAGLHLDFAHTRFPGFRVPGGVHPDAHLELLCREQLPRRYQPVTDEAERRLIHELRVIRVTGLAEFFLIVHDLMRFARKEGIPAQGRGSAADSLVAYLLRITRVDPIAHHLLFERFLHEDMRTTPDIDIDISTTHRERVIRYVYDTYGPEHTGMVCTVITFQPRLAIRQAGKAFDLPAPVIERLSRSVDRWFDPEWAAAPLTIPPRPSPPAPAGPGTGGEAAERRQAELDQVLRVAGLADRASCGSRTWQQFLACVAALVGTPRHLSIHVGGMLVTGAPLVDVAPVERATMPGRVVVQYDKDDVEDLGLIKIDLLGLRTLSVVAEALTFIESATQERVDLDRLPLTDPQVYRLCADADTLGVFQIESRAQLQTLPRTRPTSFNDLVVEVALIRPGPIQGHAVHPYLRRRQGKEPVTVLHPLLEPILRDTLGVILYQEQILEITMAVAGFTAGEADRFRRAMSRHRSREEMAQLEQVFAGGCRRRGLAAAVTAELFASIRGFAEFGFCRSHAAAFARTAYETAWLKRYHPAPFLAALLNHQPMGFYHPSVLVEDAKRRGVLVLAVDVNRSHARCRVEWVEEPGGRRLAVRLGFNQVRRLGEALRERLTGERDRGPYRSALDFWRRTRLPRRVVADLALVGAFDAFGEPRRDVLWQLRQVEEELGDVDQGHGCGPLLEAPVTPPPLADLTPQERAAQDYRVLGLTTGPHLCAFLRPQLERLGAVPLAEARAAARPGRGTWTRVAGLVITRQAPHTARGVRFFTLADETGHLDLVLRPTVYRRARATVNHHPLLIAEGRVQSSDGAVNLVVERIEAIDAEGRPAGASRNDRPPAIGMLEPPPSLSHDYS